MKFMSVREFRLNTGQARKNLEQDEAVILTANGRPFAVVSPIHAEQFDKELLAIRRARARVAVDRLRENSRADGTDRIATDEIEAVVREARRRTARP